MRVKQKVVDKILIKKIDRALRSIEQDLKFKKTLTCSGEIIVLTSDILIVTRSKSMGGH